MNSTHSLLPVRLNDHHSDGNGLLLHTKFLPQVVDRAREERMRGEHFGVPEVYSDYYDSVMSGPALWFEGTEVFRDWRQMEQLGLMSRGSWTGP